MRLKPDRVPNRAEVYSLINGLRFWQFWTVAGLTLPALAAGILGTQGKGEEKL